MGLFGDSSAKKLVKSQIELLGWKKDSYNKNLVADAAECVKVFELDAAKGMYPPTGVPCLILRGTLKLRESPVEVFLHVTQSYPIYYPRVTLRLPEGFTPTFQEQQQSHGSLNLPLLLNWKQSTTLKDVVEGIIAFDRQQPLVIRRIVGSDAVGFSPAPAPARPAAPINAVPPRQDPVQPPLQAFGALDIQDGPAPPGYPALDDYPHRPSPAAPPAAAPPAAAPPAAAPSAAAPHAAASPSYDQSGDDSITNYVMPADKNPAPVAMPPRRDPPAPPAREKPAASEQSSTFVERREVDLAIHNSDGQDLGLHLKVSAATIEDVHRQVAALEGKSPDQVNIFVWTEASRWFMPVDIDELPRGTVKCIMRGKELGSQMAPTQPSPHSMAASTASSHSEGSSGAFGADPASVVPAAPAAPAAAPPPVPKVEAAPAPSRGGSSNTGHAKELKYSDIEITKKADGSYHVLGQGQFKTVYKGKYLGTPCAISQLHQQFASRADLDDFAHEVDVMSQLIHPNIVSMMGAVTKDPKTLCFVTELCKASLYDVLHEERRQLSCVQRLSLLQGICRGMLLLHRQDPPMFHRDLKSLNILVDANLTPKVCDFGFAKARDPAATMSLFKSRVGTPLWMAVEVLEGKTYRAEKADIWSLAMVFYEVLSGKLPYADARSEFQLTQRIKGGERPVLPSEFKRQFGPLITRMWDPNPDARPSMTIVMKELDVIIEAMEPSLAS